MRIMQIIAMYDEFDAFAICVSALLGFVSIFNIINIILVKIRFN